jgi:hypothetical protein
MSERATDAGTTAVRDVDILILSYNAADELCETLRGLTETPAFVAVHQGRIIVLDNASSDGSADMVRRRFPGIELISSTTNVGFGQGMNRLAIEATADHILLLNSDVVIDSDFLTPLLDALAERPEVIAAGPKLLWPDGRIQYSAVAYPSLRLELARAAAAICPWRLPLAERVVARYENHTRIERESHPWVPEFLWATCWLTRRSEFVSSGMFDAAFPIYDEDLDLCRRWARSGRKVLYVPGSKLIHVGGASSQSRQSISKLAYAARRTYYRRYHGKSVEFAFACVVNLTSLGFTLRHRLLATVKQVCRRWRHK